MSHDTVIGLYERHARAFDRDRGRALQEQAWLDRFLAFVPHGATVLDVGCGMGEPVAAYLLASGRRVVGVDASPTLIALCRARFPQSEWIVADMRGLALDRTFDGVLAWDSLFHLTADDQRAMFERFAAHARPDAPLLFTSGPSAGEAIGDYEGEPLYHASLDAAEYTQVLAAQGFTVRAHVEDDHACGGHTAWLATKGAGIAQPGSRALASCS